MPFGVVKLRGLLESALDSQVSDTIHSPHFLHYHTPLAPIKNPRLSFFVAFIFAAAAAQSADKPNIIFLLADDIG